MKRVACPTAFRSGSAREIASASPGAGSSLRLKNGSVQDDASEKIPIDRPRAFLTTNSFSSSLSVLYDFEFDFDFAGNIRAGAQKVVRRRGGGEGNRL